MTQIEQKCSNRPEIFGKTWCTVMQMSHPFGERISFLNDGFHIISFAENVKPVTQRSLHPEIFNVEEALHHLESLN